MSLIRLFLIRSQYCIKLTLQPFISLLQQQSQRLTFPPARSQLRWHLKNNSWKKEIFWKYYKYGYRKIRLKAYIILGFCAVISTFWSCHAFQKHVTFFLAQMTCRSRTDKKVKWKFHFFFDRKWKDFIIFIALLA